MPVALISAALATKMNWGSVPEWFGAIGTILGTLIVGGGLWYEIRQRRLADRQAEEERRDALAAPARLVTLDIRTDHGRYLIKVRNDGAAPIRKLTYTAMWTLDGQDHRVPITKIRGGQSTYVGAHDQIELDCLVDGIDPAAPAKELDAEAEFVDFRGLRWVIRAGDESLRRVLTQT